MKDIMLCKSEKEIKRVQLRVQDYMRYIRKKVDNTREHSAFDNSKVIKSEIRYYYDGGISKKRVVVFLRGSGCSRVKSCGGCTFCGFYNATNKGVTIKNEDYIQQMQAVLRDWDGSISKICFYNDGSLLCEEEINFKTVLEILALIDKKEEITSITIEAKIEDINEEKLSAIRKITNKELEIAVGFESANRIVRDICINKSFSNDAFGKVVDIAKKYFIDIIPLMMLKPPFLTEREAAEDFINSLIYLETFEVKRIDIELPTVELDTLTFELWCIGEYKPVNLWTLVEILREKERRDLQVPIYISPMDYTVDSYEKSFSCNKCYHKFANCISKYNETQDSKSFSSIKCECQKKWLNIYNIEHEKDLVNRSIDCIEKLELKNGIKLDRNR